MGVVIIDTGGTSSAILFDIDLPAVGLDIRLDTIKYLMTDSVLEVFDALFY